MPEEPEAAGEPTPVYEDEEDPQLEGEAVTEMALSWLAERDRPEGPRSMEDVAMRVDPASATAARDRALQEHLKRREALKQALPVAPWNQQKLTIGKPFSTRNAPRPELEEPGPAKKKAAKKKAAKKVTAKKVTAKKKAAKKVAAKKVTAKKVAAKKVAAKKVAAKKVAAAAVPTSDADLPIEDYDQLTTAQILSMLDELDDDELDEVADYEERHRNRAEILDAIDALFEEEVEVVEPAPAPAGARKAPAKATAKKAKKAPAKKGAKKKVTAKKKAAKKKAAKEAPAKKAAKKKAAAKRS